MGSCLKLTCLHTTELETIIILKLENTDKHYRTLDRNVAYNMNTYNKHIRA